MMVTLRYDNVFSDDDWTMLDDLNLLHFSVPSEGTVVLLFTLRYLKIAISLEMFSGGLLSNEVGDELIVSEWGIHCLIEHCIITNSTLFF